MKSKEEKEDFFGRLAGKILGIPVVKAYLGRGSPKASRERAEFEALYPGASPKEKLFEYRKKNLSLLLKASLAVVFLCIMAGLFAGGQTLLKDGYLERNDAGDGSYEASLNVSRGEGDEESISVEVAEKTLDDEELDTAFKEGMKELDTLVVGENESLDHVEEPLNLVSKCYNGVFEVEWVFDGYDILDAQGVPVEENLTDEGSLVTITATLCYRKQRMDYVMYANVYKLTKTGKEKMLDEIGEAVKNADEETAFEKKFYLPSEAGGTALSWSEYRENMAPKVLALGVLVLILIWYEGKEDIKRRLKKRDEQLRMDYPDLVNKISLLLGAGLSMKGVWERLAVNYRNEKESDPQVRRYAYEEILVTYYRMKEGES